MSVTSGPGAAVARAAGVADVRCTANSSLTPFPRMFTLGRWVVQVTERLRKAAV